MTTYQGRETAAIHKKFATLRTTCDPRGHDLLDELERWMLYDNALLRTIAMAVEPDTFSRKVPDTPALRLVGGFACDPDPSCGAADAT